MKTKITLLSICLLLLAGNALLFRSLKKSKKDTNRLEKSFEISQKDVVYYKDLNGKLTAKGEVLELKHSELSKIFPQILTEIENLKIKKRRVSQYSETIIHQDKEIITELRDSIIYDTIKVKVFDYQDAYYNVNGNIQNDSVRMDIHSSDSLIQVVYKGERLYPKRWIFSPRQLEQVIQSKNPSSTIIYSKTIQISKK
jgi:hypothetical protein